MTIDVTKKGFRSGVASANKGRRFPVELLMPEEVDLLIRQCSLSAPTGVRNRALIGVMYRSGVRLSEALGLYTRDIDPIAGTLNIRQGKGKKQRIIGMDSGGFGLIAHWQVLRAQRRLNGHHPIFCTLDGQSLHPSYVRTMLQRLARKANIDKRVHPHGFRHTFAAQLAQEGVPVNTIQAQLGHTNLQTTNTYLEHIQPVDLVNALRDRAWDSVLS